MKVYIAGKITGDPNYREKFGKAARLLAKDGCIVLNPATLPEGLNQAEYMRICLAMLDCADTVYLLKDWKESEGARIELAYARKVVKAVVEAPAGNE